MFYATFYPFFLHRLFQVFPAGAYHAYFAAAVFAAAVPEVFALLFVAAALSPEVFA